MCKELEVPKFLAFIVLLLMTVLIVFHGHTLIYIFTEGITFPIFIFTLVQLVRSFKKLDISVVTQSAIGISLLILTKEQFYCYCPVLFFLVIWYLWKREPLKKVLTCSFIIIISLSMSVFFAKGYHSWVKNHYSISETGTQWQYSGWRLLEQPIYLSNSSALQYFKNPVERNLFEKILERLEENHLTRDSSASFLPQNYLLTDEYRYMSVLGVVQDTIRSAINTNVPVGMSGNQVDHLVKHISQTLFLHSWKENLIFYILRLTFYMGGPFVFFAALVAIFAINYKILTDRYWEPSTTQAFVVIAFLMIILNAVIVGLVEVQSTRYFYNSYFLYFCLFALLGKVLASKMQEKLTVEN